MNKVTLYLFLISEHESYRHQWHSVVWHHRVCGDSISSWMWSNRRQLNDNKTEMMLCGLLQLPRCLLHVAGVNANPVSVVQDIGSALKSLWWLFLCAAVWLRHTWINWFVSPIYMVISAYVRQHHSCYKSQHTALQLLAVVRFRSLHPSSGTPYHWKSSHRIQHMFFVGV